MPPIDNVPSPLEVAPPDGWRPEAEGEGDIGVFDDSFGADKAACHYRSTCTPGDLEEAEERYQEEQARALEGEILDEAENLANLVDALNNQDIEDEITDDDVKAIILGILEYANYNPGDTLKLLTYLNIRIDSHEMNAEALKGFASAIRNAQGTGEIENYIAIYLGDAIAPGKDPIAGLLSGGLNFSPVGDFKGPIEAALGRDLLTGDSLSGFARWAGLAGLVGLAELKYGDEIARLIRNGGRLGRMGTTTARTIDEGMAARIIGCATRSFNSFSPDTKVATTAGLVTILSLKGQVNAEALAYNEATGEVGYYPITAFHENLDPVTINLTIDNDLTDDNPGLVLETTPEHPFYVNNTWVNAEDLTIGTVLTSLNENNEIIPLGTITATQRVEKEQVMYNLTVETANTFFVGEGQWLVHNTNCPTKALIKQFENSFGIDSVHGLRRHGAGTTIEQQLWRAKTGYTPDGIQGSIRDATRFFDNDDLLEAYSLAVNSYRPGQPFVDIPFDRVVGEGYYAGGKVYGTSNVVRVQFNLEGKIVSGYPVLP